MALYTFRVKKTCRTGCSKRGRGTVWHRVGEVVKLDTDNKTVQRWLRKGCLRVIKNG